MSNKINDLLDTLTPEQIRALAFGAVEGIARMGALAEWDSETIENVGEALGDGMPDGMPRFGDTGQDHEALNYYRRLLGWTEEEIAEEDEAGD